MADYDSLRDLSVKAGDHVSAGRENELLRRVARMTGETAPGRRTSGAGGSTAFPLETTAAGITVSVSAGNVFWHNKIFGVSAADVAAAADLEIWIELRKDDDTAEDFDPTKAAINSGTTITSESNPPNQTYFKLATVVSDGTTATVTKVWNGGDVTWPGGPFAFYG